ncbi:hypothetical protein HPB49_018226 [Dermacentor silvarum]|uniref:Uncharacterized protein n=1 Tax=Dermacentor silvarum TaxID=543639 RepID=A0ACB8CGM9_DERSI|nr:hypothetical protein HPB49_018226 [Dermacentor silvarum]
MDQSEDDGDPDSTPEQGRQPTREGDTLPVHFPVSHTFQCCERSCRAAHAAAQWTSRWQSLQRRLEQQHHCRIRRTVNQCTVCGSKFGLRPSSHACLAAASISAPPVSQPHQCGQCSMSFPRRTGMSNIELWHRIFTRFSVIDQKRSKTNADTSMK